LIVASLALGLLLSAVSVGLGWTLIYCAVGTRTVPENDISELHWFSFGGDVSYTAEDRTHGTTRARLGWPARMVNIDRVYADPDPGPNFLVMHPPGYDPDEPVTGGTWGVRPLGFVLDFAFWSAVGGVALVLARRLRR
jgi:hypothetical protein